jgi:hypothetical protein
VRQDVEAVAVEEAIEGFATAKHGMESDNAGHRIEIMTWNAEERLRNADCQFRKAIRMRGR